MNAKLVYVHDPMCSWCWAFAPVYERLRRRLPDTVTTTRLLGGLAPDDDTPMAPQMRDYLEATWRRIMVVVPGTCFNFAFWSDNTPRRSTWPACRAVIAAREQEPTAEAAMIGAIQRAYYLDARNPSDKATLVAIAAENGLDAAAFSAALDAPSTREILATEIGTARRLAADSFPSLRLLVDGRVTPITVDYHDPAPMDAAIRACLAR